MAPKAARNKKAETSRRQDKSPELSGSVDEYLIARLRDAVDRVNHKVTEG